MLDDPTFTDEEATSVRRVVLSSGKVGYDAIAKRDATSSAVAVVKVEQLYPFPGDQIAQAIRRYGKGEADVVWLQEEPANMGAAGFIRRRIADVIGRDIEVVARVESASPATGSAAMHALEQDDLLRRAIGVS